MLRDPNARSLDQGAPTPLTSDEAIA